jgi:predicted ATPase/class 3 adenylate cyclase
MDHLMGRLPTGIVTFLFTDIEGSTRLLQELGRDAYDRVQSHHADIMRDAIAEGSGVEIRTEGDSFFVVFDTPVGALGAAVAAQRAMVDTPIRVRMGLHSGEGRPGGDDYLGIEVNRAARIAAAGHGGQVLLSDATRALVEHALPDGVAIRDLGNHRLKDIAHSEHLFDLVVEGLPSDFPAPTTLDARPNNLPLQLSSFVGRDTEIAETVRLLGEHRLVTLTGPGGTGKTRLALEVATSLLPSFSDGVFFVDLASIAEPSLVAPAIGKTLGVNEQPGRELVDTLADHVASRELLLVPDNFEQVLEARSVVERLLGAAPRLRVLATSRTPLGLYGEQEHDVPPLGLPDPGGLPELDALSRSEAVALFITRARASKPDFEVTLENAPAVAEICARLDGLPLAIELAASRIKVLSPPAILSRLGHSLDLLTASARNLLERQRTLRGAIDWSYGLLDEPERRLFSRLSVFAGGAHLEAVEAVANPDGELSRDTLATLFSLVDKSLVRQTETEADEPRFRMLETIREFARDRCEVEWDGAATRRRHAEHYLGLAEAAEPHLSGASQVAWLDRLDRDQDNLQAALRWAIETDEPERAMAAAAGLWRFWQMRGHYSGGRDLLERLLARPGGRTAARAKAEDAAGSLAYWQREEDDAEAHYGEALAIYRELRDRRGIAQTTYDLAFIPLIRGIVEEGVPLLQEAISLYEELGDESAAARAKGDLGLFLMMSGDHRVALPLMEEALARTRQQGDLFRLADDLLRVSEAQRALGKHDEARRGHLEALDSMERAGAPEGIAAVLQIMASVESDLGRHQRAMRLFGAGRALAASIRGVDVPLPFQFADPVGDSRRAIGDEAVERALAEGRAMTWDQAVAYARTADD